MRIAYLLYGLAVLAGLGWAEYRGWSLVPPAEVHGIPRSVRENPGAYRPIYHGSARYLRGK